MKYLPALVLALTALTLGAEAPRLTRVRVHPSQAWTTRSLAVSLKRAGLHRLTLTDVPHAEADRLQVRATGLPGLKVRLVTVLPPEPGALDPELQRLEAALKQVQSRLTHLEEQTRVHTAALLQVDRLLPESTGNAAEAVLLDGTTLPSLLDALDFRRATLRGALEALQRETHTAQTTRTRLEQDRQARTEAQPPATSSVQVELEADTPGRARLDLEQPTPHARWRPFYDVRLKGSRLELACYASVSQASGEPWQGVTLEISRTAPDQQVTPLPLPAPVVLSYLAPEVVQNGLVEGRVLDAAGRGLASAQVTLQTEKGPRLKTQTDGRGDFRFLQVPPGSYRLAATFLGLPETWSYLNVEPGKAVSTGLRFTPANPVRGGSAVVEVVATTASLDKTEVRCLASFTPHGLALESTPSGYEEAGSFGRVWILEGSRDLPSDARPRRHLLARTTVEATVVHRARPRTSGAVYRVAQGRPGPELPWFPAASAGLTHEDVRLGDVPLPELGLEGATFNLGPVPGRRAHHQRLGARVGRTREGREWTLRERLVLTSDLDHPVTVDVEDLEPQSGTDAIRIQRLPGTTPPTRSTPGRAQWQVTLPARGRVEVALGWRISAPFTGTVPQLQALGLPDSD